METKHRIITSACYASLLLLLGITNACQEDIDMSNRYIFEEQTVLSFLEEEPSGQFSEYVRLLKEVPISSQSNSSVAQLLSVRGHYTCFAPNNEAISDYLDSLHAEGLITEPSWNGFRDNYGIYTIPYNSGYF